MPASRSRLDAIDQVLALDLGGRGIGSFFTPGAALAAARALRGARHVLIATGFCVPPGLPETDGPPGAAVLGRALRRLGATVRYVTDPAVVEPLGAVLKALEEPVDIEIYPEGDGAAGALLDSERPTHLVAIERPGRARSGEYLSARGESVAAWNRPIDELFLVGGGGRRGPSQRARPVTIAVGDGGNEIGMGNVRSRLSREGRLMARIASVVGVDHLVVAGTSNWGAYGIVAALERLARRPLLHTPSLERRLIEACVDAGAVDGVLRRRTPTVDGLPLEAHTAVVELLRLAAPGRPAPAARRSGSKPDRV
ncbi:MAG TPA: DUF4392 domain-containing protein [Methylomirabilota bacterium]|nr:DUF4392 domain-containing protein [Methylomirabilota bacterium]